ncbi:hypothetical protein BGW36DRAFT_422110 [Talaromyces proteolyticus]|uniref:Polyketide cyclase/dehydrase n=1 Tax=Talaromyces proteolyticus TaxID=1131652 RepID=A0AAD4L5N5_9EURO|nr:uncharacterized protein BGW36DRAFT_422110 [Talaromyces proteolyticus]KAH8705556.1 hypothetical protein BGW36DRAFT_422110 [Talaromyces proteolyticus]
MAIETETEIAAPPCKVREILLDFSNYPKWHTGFIKQLEPEDTSKSLSSLQPGDKVKCNIDDMEFVASITENSENLFQWQGPPVYGLIAGLHSFHFDLADDGSSTVYKQTEKFSGPIAFLMTPSLLGRKMLGQFNQFNSHLKAYAEASG